MTSGSDDHDLYARQGIGEAIGFGERPAVIVVDFQRAFTDGPLAAEYPEAALRAAAELLEVARDADVPVYYTVCAYDDIRDAGPFGQKCPGLIACRRGTEMCDVDHLVAPADGDVVLEKTQPSAFFGTGLAERLRYRGVDSVVICGATTSGCVRATAVDAMSHGFRVSVVIEAVSDRAQAAHDQALFDLGHKYADVIPLTVAAEGLERVGNTGRGAAAPKVGLKR